MTPHRHHAIDYIEFSSTNLEVTRKFYEQAFGWQFNAYGPDYLGIQDREGGESGGIAAADEVREGGPLVILYSQDLEESLRSVTAAGGEIVKEPFAFPGGRRFHFKDPSGNELAVWSTEGGLSLDS